MVVDNTNKIQSLLELYDIARYADRIEDAKIFKKAEMKILEKFNSYIGNIMRVDENAKTNGIGFTGEQTELILSYMRQICKPQRNFFTTSTLLVSIWYPMQVFVPMNQETWRLTWHVLTNVIDAGKDEWFMSYWSFAEQYYRFQLDSGRENTTRKPNELFCRQQRYFKEFHLVIQAYILYKENYSLLERVMNFSHVFPKDYILVDNILEDIIDDVIRLNKRPFPYLSNNYMMAREAEDILSDERIFAIILKYLALLLYRLKKIPNDLYLNHYRYREVDYDNVNSLQMGIQCISLLQDSINNDDVVKAAKKLKYYTATSCDEMNTILKEKKKQFHDKKEDLYNNPKISKEKIEEIKNRLIREAKNCKGLYYVPTENDSDLKDDIENLLFTCSVNFELPVEDVAEGMVRQSSNLESTMIHALLLQEKDNYCRYFVLNKPKCFYTIRFEDIPKAFDKLCLNENLVILSFGVQLSSFDYLFKDNKCFKNDENGNMSYNGARIIDLQSTMIVLVVINKSDLPYMYRYDYGSDDLKCIDSETKLYSNIDNINNNSRNLVIAWDSMLTRKKASADYVMLSIKHISGSLLYDIDKIKAI